MCCTFLHFFDLVYLWAFLWPQKSVKCTKRHPPPDRMYGRSTQGLWCMQLFWSTHYEWRTRFEWRTHRVDRTSLHYQPTPLVPRPRFGQGPTQVPIIGREGTLVWTLPKRTSPQPTRGDVGLKVYFRQFVWYVRLWPADIIEQYRVVASLIALKLNPLTFFSSGPCFTDIWQWSVDWHRHLAINSHTFLSSRIGPEGGSNFVNFYVTMSREARNEVVLENT